MQHGRNNYRNPDESKDIGRDYIVRNVIHIMTDVSTTLCRLGPSTIAISQGPSFDSVVITIQGDGVLEYCTTTKVTYILIVTIAVSSDETLLYSSEH